MFGWLRALKYRKQINELEKLVEEAKRVGVIEPDADAGKMIETVAETLGARLTVGMSMPQRRRKKKNDDDDDVARVTRRKMPDIDAYMAQQMDMMLTMFDKMFNLYERMDRKFGEIAKRHMQKYGRVVKEEEKKEETFEDKLIEKIVEKYLLGELSGGAPAGGTSLSPDNANEEEALKALFQGLGELAGSNQAKEKLVEKLEEEVVEDV